jgi:E3 ubiquitin-protein ligase SHPRH
VQSAAADGGVGLGAGPAKLVHYGEATVPHSRRRIEYNTIPRSLIEDIDSMETVGSYGSKIQMLVRHLLYLQMAETGAKSIVFSAFPDSLHSTSPRVSFRALSMVMARFSRRTRAVHER